MKKSLLVKMIAGAYMGGAISLLFGTSLTEWKWWVFFLPTVVLYEIGAQIQSEENND
jgi:hypothetical protein